MFHAVKSFCLKVKPLFKKSSRSGPKNYRPISLLSLASKTIEKTIHIHTQEYRDRNGLLYKYQFLRKISTDSCFVQITDFILRGMDRGFHGGMILVDTLDHTVLLQKIESISFKELITEWFQSCLSNRKYIVALDVMLD